MNVERLIDQLKQDEGLRLFPYQDTKGKLTIGYGRNLQAKGISEAEASMMLWHDVAEAYTGLKQALFWFETLDDVRQRVLVDMAFNMGVMGLLGFQRTLASIQDGDYKRAAEEMLESLWAKQVGSRAVRLARMMETGNDITKA